MIYHILPESEPFSEFSGGALSRWAANVLRGDENGTIVCPWSDDSWRFPRERVWSFSGIRNYVWCLRILRSASMMDLRLAILTKLLSRFARRLKKGDTVYIHNRPEFAVVLSPVCRKIGARIVLHMQNSHLAGWFPEPYRSRLNLDAMVFCSDFLREEAAPYTTGSCSIAIIPNGADETMFYPDGAGRSSHTDCPLALMVGRLVPAKGVHVFADALGLLLRRGVSISGKIIGGVGFGGDRTSEYVDGIKRSLPANVVFGKYVAGPDLAAEFRRAAIFCCPSVFNEPFGMVNVEAMATRLPVIASAVGGIPEIFQQGGAILVRPGSATELADALEFLVANPVKAQELAEGGFRAYKMRFRWARIREMYLDLVGQTGMASA